jgi:hypothetical protein
MSRSTITLSLKHHINDLTDILSDIQHNRLEGDIESVWYEFWDAVLNYWLRRLRTPRLDCLWRPKRGSPARSARQILTFLKTVYSTWLQ